MCADKQEPKTKLSKAILEMKFMQRSALRDIKKDSEEQQRIDDEHWVLDLPQLKQKVSQFVTESGYGPCEDLAFGRMSFKGFNLEIEKLMSSKITEQELALAEEREKEIGVDNEEMAARYESLVGTIAKKFTKKRHRKEVEEYLDDDEEKEDSSKVKKKSKDKPREFLKPAD